MSNFKNWIENLKVGQCGNGWFVRIDGCDVFGDIHRSENCPDGYKGRKSLSIVEKLETEQEAKQAAKDWLNNQLNILNGKD